MAEIFPISAGQILSKVKINGVLYNLKDADARSAITTLLGDHALEVLKAAAWQDVATAVSTETAVDTSVATTKAVKEYVDAQIQTIPEFDVVIDEKATDKDEPKTAPSAETFHKIYMVAEEGSTGSYAEFITIKSGDGESATYTWEKIGTTAVNLADYVKKTTTIAGIDLQDSITKEELQSALELGEMAYADTASGSTTLNTIDSITMKEVTVAGNATVTTSEADAELTKGDYTPAGEVTGEAIKGGSINVTVKDAETATAASLTYAAYTPAGQVTMTKDNAGTFQVSGTVSKPEITVTAGEDTFIKSLKEGADAATFSEGAFTPASIADGFFSAGAYTEGTLSKGEFPTIDETKTTSDTFAKSGLLAHVGKTEGHEGETDVDDETLVFEVAPTDSAINSVALTSGTLPSWNAGSYTAPSIDTTKFNGGSKAADTFSANKIMVVDAEAAPTVSAELKNAPVFTGDTFTPAFAGTEVAEMKVTKAEYLKQEIDTQTFTPEAATLGFAGTKVEQLIVTGVKYDKADATAAYSTKVTPEVDTYTKTDKTIEITVNPD